MEVSGREEIPDRPIVGAGVVIVDGDRVLLVKRAHEPLKGEWSLPGGAVEVGDAVEAALVREVREETCLDVTVGPVVEVLDRIGRDADDRVEYPLRHRRLHPVPGGWWDGEVRLGRRRCALGRVAQISRAYRLTTAAAAVIDRGILDSAGLRRCATSGTSVLVTASPQPLAR